MAFQAAEDTEQSSKTWAKGDKAHLSHQVEQVMSSNGWFGCRMATLKKTSGCCSVMPKGSILKMHTSKRQGNLHQPHLFFLQPGWTMVNRWTAFFTSPANVRRSCMLQCWSPQGVTRWEVCLEMRPKRSTSGTDFYQLILAENERHWWLSQLLPWLADESHFAWWLAPKEFDEAFAAVSFSNSVTMVESSSGPSTAALTAVLSSPHLKHLCSQNPWEVFHWIQV